MRMQNVRELIKNIKHAAKKKVDQEHCASKQGGANSISSA